MMLFIYLFCWAQKWGEGRTVPYWGQNFHLLPVSQTRMTQRCTFATILSCWQQICCGEVLMTLVKKVEHDCDSARCCSRTKGDATGRHLSARWATTRQDPDQIDFVPLLQTVLFFLKSVSWKSPQNLLHPTAEIILAATHALCPLYH